MLSKYITPGDRIEINGVSRGEKDSKGVRKSDKVYQSQVYDLLSEDRLEIVMPMEKTKLVLLPIDSEYEMFFYTKGGLYQCYARITERYKTDNVYLIVMELISNLSKYQRREFYRLSCALDVSIRHMTEEEETAAKASEYVFDESMPMEKAIIVDISGGGVRCVGPSCYDADEMVFLNFALNVQNQLREYTTAGVVLQSHGIESRPGEYEYRVKFDNMKTRDREEIIRYIFDEERKYRKRAKGE